MFVKVHKCANLNKITGIIKNLMEMKREKRSLGRQKSLTSYQKLEEKESVGRCWRGNGRRSSRNGSDNREDGLTKRDWELVRVSDGGRVRPDVPKDETAESEFIAQRRLESRYQRCIGVQRVHVNSSTRVVFQR